MWFKGEELEDRTSDIGVLIDWYIIEINTGEQDSRMYQSVGHEGVSLYAEAMGLPLYIGTTFGKTSQTSLAYEEEAGDEVEDLADVLKRVKV